MKLRGLDLMKRLVDILLGSFVLLCVSPILLLFCLLIYLQDFHNPLYLAPRMGRKERIFRMIKLRSMIINADKSGVDSTANNDLRITRVGALVRKFKLDELTQLINVVNGDMSLVGPRPNVKRETDLYTPEEKQLLSVRPGITDLASIVFSDEGDILEGSSDADLDYNQVIRPGKGYLGLFYINKRKRLRGGIRTTIYDNVVRVDNVQHVQLAILKILAVFGPRDWAAGVD